MNCDGCTLERDEGTLIARGSQERTEAVRSAQKWAEAIPCTLCRHFEPTAYRARMFASECEACLEELCRAVQVESRDAALAEAERLCEEMENARTGEVLLDAGWASACAAMAVRIRALREGTE